MDRQHFGDKSGGNQSRQQAELEQKKKRNTTQRKHVGFGARSLGINMCALFQTAHLLWRLRLETPLVILPYSVHAINCRSELSNDLCSRRTERRGSTQRQQTDMCWCAVCGGFPGVLAIVGVVLLAFSQVLFAGLRSRLAPVSQLRTRDEFVDPFSPTVFLDHASLLGRSSRSGCLVRTCPVALSAWPAFPGGEGSGKRREGREGRRGRDF